MVETNVFMLCYFAQFFLVISFFWGIFHNFAVLCFPYRALYRLFKFKSAQKLYIEYRKEDMMSGV